MHFQEFLVQDAYLYNGFVECMSRVHLLGSWLLHSDGVSGSHSWVGHEVQFRFGNGEGYSKFHNHVDKVHCDEGQVQGDRLKLGRRKSVQASSIYASDHEGLCSVNPSTGSNFLTVECFFEALMSSKKNAKSCCSRFRVHSPILPHIVPKRNA